MPVPFSCALYYPTIDIRDEKWLRSAVVFWDSIRTIVPDGLQEPYSSDFARQLRDEGFLEPLLVSSNLEAIESLAAKVLDYITDPETAGLVMEDESIKEFDPGLTYDMLDFRGIHRKKMAQSIRDYLDKVQAGNEWYIFSSPFGSFYMTLLASTLAERNGLALVTESSAADRLALAARKGKSGSPTHYHWTGNFGPQTKVAPGMLFDLIVQGIELPDTITVKDLLKFKKKHREELSVFRREISRLIAEIPDNLSLQALRQVLHDQYEAQVIPALKSLRHSLRAQGWDAALNGLLKVSFFSAAPTSAAILAGVPGSVALLAGVGVSLTATGVLLANQVRSTKLNSSYSYLLSLEKQWYYKWAIVLRQNLWCIRDWSWHDVKETRRCDKARNCPEGSCLSTPAHLPT